MKFSKVYLICPTVAGLFLILNILNLERASGQQLLYPPQQERWNPDSLGNQRAVVQVKSNSAEATVLVRWRNRNVRPDQRVLIVDSATNRLLPNVRPEFIRPEEGIITFPAASGKGIYYVYYLPYHLGGRSKYYPDAIYKTDPKHPVPRKAATMKRDYSKAEVLRFESVNDFNRNDPMEIIATARETEDLKNRHRGQDYMIFPERRDFPIKMRTHIPQRWTANRPLLRFTDTARRGERFTFQLGIWAHAGDLQHVNMVVSQLKDTRGNVIPSDSLTCFNTGGTDYTGRALNKRVDVKAGSVQAFWFGLHVPEKIAAGTYQGEIVVSAKNIKVRTVPVQLTIPEEVSGAPVKDEPWRQMRLHWINSTLAQENTVIKPYTPLAVSGNSISFLGRKLILSDNGLPQQIQSYFTEEMTSISGIAKNVLAAPFAFKIMRKDGREVALSNAGLTFIRKDPGTVSWQAEGRSAELTMEVKGSLEFDGFVRYEVRIIAEQELSLQDIAMQMPMDVQSARYMLGLGQKGGLRPDTLNWLWDVTHKNQDGMWLGDVNAGIQFSLRDENYQRPLNTNFYLQKPLVEPRSWANEGKGGIKIREEGNTVYVNNYSGERGMKKGDTLYYNFTLLLTPFHPLRTDEQWNERYYHAYKPVDSVVKSGANLINIHHGNELNPYINYPFIATREMKSYIDSAHQAGLKVKIYNTVREVSNRMYELHPLRSLGTEIFTPGKGQGYSWLQEHVNNDYIAAWYVPKYKDAALINSGMSRWHNYYVEGMNWLVENAGIDGIYLDDVAFDRVTMKRIKRVMTKNGHAGMIDLHSANQYNERDGYNNSANLYMEHFPYLNRLWFGEYFDYEAGSPDFYLTEVSGIPFGLMGEMLEGGGNPFRGMIYGMTNRMPYQKEKPDQIWKVWDQFGMEGSKMIGYWVRNNPVRTSESDVLTTIYQKDKKILVALASWAPANTSIKLEIDWKKLGINPGEVRITAPEISGIQKGRSYKLTEEIQVEKNKGVLLVIE